LEASAVKEIGGQVAFMAKAIGLHDPAGSHGPAE
jgi:hypothetical protein